MRVNLIYYLTATLLGGLHALEPGHGKTVVAAYLIGTKGRKIDAVLLGLVVTLTHTSTVILLAIAAKLASTRITLTEESLHGYLGIVAGLIILAVGIWMLVGRIRGKEPFHFHAHAHPHHHSHHEHHDHYHEQHDLETHDGFHTHSHDHGHDLAHDHSHGQSHDHNHTHNHDPFHAHAHPHHHSHHEDHDHYHEQHDLETHDGLHAHSHEHAHSPQRVDVPSEKRLGYLQLFLLGVSGGLVPCPAAIAILLAAVGSGRLGEGLTYILMFSLGLAAVLIAIGIIVVGAGQLASRFMNAKRFARKIAIASAGLITLIGVVTLFNSVRHLV